jgi:dUTP pyrophosphatase
MAIIKIVPLTRDGRTAALPAYQTAGAAAVDLCAFLQGALTLLPGQRHAVPTGLCMEIPPGYGGFVLARSGLATRFGLTMANGVGLIDSDYRGEVLVSLTNAGDAPFILHDGDRIAQFVLLQTPAITFLPVESLSPTARGDQGFGSTGRNNT